ncbi:hypothetical protein EMCG_03085 [[Emmonsia] crescens]|uniref:Uncharacterized protein n=1 Tax=[Emmonsia] crescens TaxID=73230 RepID=A0A0G2J0P0_9EURO|nr:hypothetical protein EMCG_03085 [Emmonsia crescens UAMH 3008]
MSSDMSSPLKFADTSFNIVDTFKRFKVETLPNYHSADYYPAQIGQQWRGLDCLAWPMTDPSFRESRYVFLKIFTAEYSTQNNEIDLYKQLDSAASEINHLEKTLYQ